MTGGKDTDRDLAERIYNIIDTSGLPTEESRDALRSVEGALDLRNLYERMRSIYLGLPMQSKSLFLRGLADYCKMAESGNLFALVDTSLSYFKEGFVISGDELRRLREAKHLSQRGLARALGLDPNSAATLISTYEKGRRTLTLSPNNNATLAIIAWVMKQYSAEGAMPELEQRASPRVFDGVEARKIREQMGLTQAALAESIGFPGKQNLISRWESGRFPKHVRYGDTSQAYLLKLKENRYNPFDI